MEEAATGGDETRPDETTPVTDPKDANIAFDIEDEHDVMIGHIARIPDVSMAWRQLALELNMAADVSIIYTKSHNKESLVSEYASELLMEWISRHPVEANTTKLFSIHCDMNLHNAEHLVMDLERSLGKGLGDQTSSW